jgi:conserved repeat domain
MSTSLGRFGLVVSLLLILIGLLPATTPVRAAPNLRVQVNQRGDFILIGNTFGFECAAGVPAPVVGTVGNCGTNTTDSAPDIYWRSDSPIAGQAEANTTISAAQARSTAMLTIPAGATVTHAYLYWSATLNSAGVDTQATLDRPGSSGFNETISADETFTGPNNSYKSVADITSIVQTNGSGAYRVSDVAIADLVNMNNSNLFAGWWMVVLYRLDSMPINHITIYDGHDGISSVSSQNMTVSGFVIPSSFSNAKLAVVAMEGDDSGLGDSLSFNGTPLSDAQNPSDNFFNGTRSFMGTAVSVAGDLPQLTGGAASLSGIDLDVVDVTGLLSPGQTSASITASTFADVYFLSTLVTSFPTAQPEVSLNTKTVTDLNGGALSPGDTLEYTITITNSGSDAAINTSLVDPLPVGITYQPGSLEIVSGANAGVKTDASGDDQAEYDAANRRIVMRLGNSADATTGGTLAIGTTTSLRFRATLDAVCAGPITIANQASISTMGQMGAQTFTTLTNGDSFGAPTTIEPNFRCVTIGVDGDGSVANSVANTNSLVVADGTNVTLTATGNLGSSFVSWSGAASGTSNPLTVLVDANKSITASFALSTYTITPSAGANGSISPNSVQNVTHGQNQSFTITPDAGYQVADVLVDGVSVGVVNSYSFTNVGANHTISAQFEPITYTITPSAGMNGSISPNSLQTVKHGESKTFTITPDAGYQVADVLVDGVSVGALNSYSFTNVTANHSIEVSFSKNPATTYNLYLPFVNILR